MAYILLKEYGDVYCAALTFPSGNAAWAPNNIAFKVGDLVSMPGVKFLVFTDMSYAIHALMRNEEMAAVSSIDTIYVIGECSFKIGNDAKLVGRKILVESVEIQRIVDYEEIRSIVEARRPCRVDE